MAATALRWQPLLPPNTSVQHRHRHRQMVTFKVEAFRRSDMDSFAKRMASGEAWRDAWRSANDGVERFLFEAKKTAERIDRRYALSHRLSSVARAAADQAREIDRDFEIGLRWRTFTMDFRRNWPKVSHFFFSLCFMYIDDLSIMLVQYLRVCVIICMQYRVQLNKFLDSPVGKGFVVSIVPIPLWLMMVVRDILYMFTMGM